MKMRIDEFFALVAKEGGQYEVKTPQGWKKLGDLYLKKNKESYLLRLESGKTLGCSSDHLVMTKEGWRESEKLDLQNDMVDTIDGFDRIDSSEYLGRNDTFDWEVLSDEHAYYANGIVSHNTGKTAKVKQYCEKPVIWNGREYKGYAVFDVPIAQFEEMGDLHGMPSRHIQMAKAGDGQPVTQWVPEEVIQGWLKDGWDVMPSSGVRTMYAPPDWVPCQPGPSILLLDDWNRASVRIIKGIMQLLQNYGMVSWKLPEGCNIVLTGNPDEQDYLVTSIDNAILTRIRSVTLKHDAKEWATWAQSAGLDPRGINFLLRYPEMMVGDQRTNPRTLSQCFRDMKRITEFKTKEQQTRFKIMADSLLDEQTVSSLITFMERDVELVIEPEDIIAGRNWQFVEGHINKLMTAREKRLDILGVMFNRLFSYIVQPTTIPTKSDINNFQRFCTLEDVPGDLRHNICMRLARLEDGGRSHQWILGNKELVKQIMEVV